MQRDRIGRTAELSSVWKGPRPIDIDILFYDNHVFKSPKLDIPHASIQERDFVLKPLVDLIPELVHPILKKTIKELDEENDKINPNLSHPKRIWNVCNPLTNEEVILDFTKETVGMGVINATKDSFSLSAEEKVGADIHYNFLLNKSREFVDNGYKILDIGGESTRPSANKIDDETELSRIIPMIKKIKENSSLKNILISLDTRKSYVAKKGIEAGAAIINDVSGGLYDEKIVDVAAEKNVPYIITHARGTPDNMTHLNTYSNLVEEVIDELKARVNVALDKGVSKWNIFVDPGIGFAKRRNQNIEIIRNLDIIQKHLPYPIVLGYSNKKFIQEITGENDTVYGNSVLAGISVHKGASIIRLHDPKMYKSILLADSVYKERKIFL